ncbi:putative U box domain, Zinc finger, RING/FYVE/PHD-type [Helianthus annuus]|nr:putative U box domain, Zinc finger, RING/FYVE/PHD-type [Helianthus annuus]
MGFRISCLIVYGYTRYASPLNHRCLNMQEVMGDPCVAADGYTYERVAIEKRLEESDCSPMTNLPLTSRSLTPNYTLLSAILEWKSRT